MFDFRIIDTKDGNQVIRRDLKTPYSALTPLQYIEYTNMEVQLYIADRQKKKCQKESEHRRPFIKIHDLSHQIILVLLLRKLHL